MIKTYKIIYGLEDVNSSQLFVRSNMENLRGQILKLYKEHFRKVHHHHHHQFIILANFPS